MDLALNILQCSKFCILPGLVHLWHEMGSKGFIFYVSELIRKGTDAPFPGELRQWLSEDELFGC